MKYLFVSCLFFLITIRLSAQNNQLQAIYKVTYKPNKENSDKKVEYMILEINNLKSHFYNLDLKKIDSLVIKNDALLTDDYPLPNLTFSVFKDLSSKNIQISGNFNQFEYVFKEEETIVWNLLMEKKNPVKLKNDKFSTRTAETYYGGRGWLVEYTQEIPIPDGPYVFSGLPGLVCKAFSVDRDYIFELVDIRKTKQNRKFTTIKNNITREEITSLINDFLKKPSDQKITYKNIWGDIMYYESKGKNDDSYKSNEERIKNIINSFNNPIDKSLFIINLR